MLQPQTYSKNLIRKRGNFERKFNRNFLYSLDGTDIWLREIATRSRNFLVLFIQQADKLTLNKIFKYLYYQTFYS